MNRRAAERGTGGATPESARPSEFAEQVADALAHLFDPVHLQTHPLGRYARSRRSDSVEGTGRALRAVIEAAIERLKPAEDARGDGDPRARRGYELMRSRYVEGLEPEAVRRRLGIGKTLYYREHNRAVDALVSLLAEQLLGTSADGGEAGSTEGADRLGEARPAARVERGMPAAHVAGFVGRERELAQLLTWLGYRPVGRTTEAGAAAVDEGGAARPRLITLTGPAGTGKTRLALQLAAAVALRDDVAPRVVELAALRDADLVLPTIAAALGVSADSDDALPAALKAHLRDALMVLVLDNFEQVLPAAEAVAALVRATRRLAVVVTSRAPLNVYGEQELPVRPLALPPTGADPAEAARAEAVQLFTKRARLVDPEFALDDENAPAVAEICRRLDGLPLAIELAAARTRVLAPAALLTRLDRRLELLTAGPRDRTVRQRTLRGAIDWSYDLLTEDDRVLFRRLAVFEGGWTVEAAESVCSGDDRPHGWGLGALQSLVDQSLVVRDEGSAGRFRMLETIHEYAGERLPESGEEEEMRGRHAAYFLSRSEAVSFAESDAPRLYDWCERDIENLRAALRTLEAQGDYVSAVTLARHLATFWRLRGHAQEGWQYFRRLLRHVDEEKVERFRWVMNAAGSLAAVTGELDDARQLLERALALSWREGRPEAWVGAVNNLAIVMRRQGDLVGAQHLLEDALPVARGTANQMQVAMTLHNLGSVLYLRRELEAARAVQEESVALRRSMGDAQRTANALMDLGVTLAEQGRSVEGRALLREALATQAEIKVRGHYANSIEGLAGLDAANDPHRALRLAGAAASIRRAAGTPLPAAEAADLERRLAPARAALSKEEQDRAWREGEAMSEDEAIALALG